MSLFEKYQVPPISKPLKHSRNKSPTPPLLIEHDLYLYCFPMSAKYYAKQDKSLHSALCDQMTNIPSVSAIIDFNYEKEYECLIIIKQDFLEQKKLTTLFKDKNINFTEIHVIDFLKQVFRIYSDMHYLKKSIKNLNESKFFVYETERNERFYKLEAFFCDENLLYQEKEDINKYNPENNKMDVFQLGLIALKMLSKNPIINENMPFDATKSNEPNDLIHFKVSSVLKNLLGKMLAIEENLRPSFEDLKNMFFFNPKAQKNLSGLNNNMKPIHSQLMPSNEKDQKSQEIKTIKKQEVEEDDEMKALPLGPLFEIIKKRGYIADSVEERKKNQEDLEKTLETKLFKVKGFVSFLKDNFIKNTELEKNLRIKARKMINFLRQEIKDILERVKENAKFKAIYEENQNKLNKLKEKVGILDSNIKQVMQNILNKWNNKYLENAKDVKNTDQIFGKINKLLEKIK